MLHSSTFEWLSKGLGVRTEIPDGISRVLGVPVVVSHAMKPDLLEGVVPSSNFIACDRIHQVWNVAIDHPVRISTIVAISRGIKDHLMI